MKKSILLSGGWKLKKIECCDTLDIESLDSILERVGNAEEQLFQIRKMPAQVHEILINEGIIENPNIHGNSEVCLWVGKSDWLYLNDFEYEPDDSVTSITFNGLDVFADIYLNGERIAQHNDVYLPRTVDITGKLKSSNRLVLHFHSAEKRLDSIKLPKELEGRVARPSKARVFYCSFSDYLGPKPYLVRVGVYGDIVIEAVDKCRIDYVDIYSKLSDDLSSAKINVAVSYAGDAGGSRVELDLVSPDGSIISKMSKDLPEHSENIAGFECTVENPQLWWPRLHGPQPLYRINVRLVTGVEVHDEAARRIGLRKIDMAGDMDFRINNHPIKLWGGNLAPLDTLTNCYNKSRTESILSLAENAHMECFRIWGESERLDDDFYDMCDERGFLLWHDFFATYSMYPNDRKLLDLMRQEAEYQLKRLKHRPCILLWCSGNESIMGRDYNYPGEDYQGMQLLSEIYPQVCKKYDPDRYYHRSSPDGGAFANDPLAGDTHGYTHIWYVPGSYYPVFLSENCRVSTPALRTMKIMMKPEDLWPEGYKGHIEKNSEMSWPDEWNKYNSNFGYVKLGEVETFYDPTDLDAMLYRLGWGHGLYIRSRVERYRRGRPIEMKDINTRITKGHLLWKLNTSSNHIFFGVVDYFMEPYIAYYSLKRAYSPVLLSFDVGNFINLWMVNDTMKDIRGKVYIKLFNPLANKVEKHLEVPFEVKPDESKVLTDLNCFGQFKRNNILYAYAVDENGERIAESFDYVDMERHMRFPTDARITAEVEDGALYLTCDKYVRSAELLGNNDGDEFGWLFEDNYFDMIPGQVKKVKVLGKHDKGRISIKGYYSDIITEIEYKR